MSIELNHHSRRGAIQKMMMAMAALGAMPFTMNAESGALSNTTLSGNNELSPFYVPPAKPLEPGPGGLDIRTLVHSTQTNQQFSCVEFAVAAKKMGPAPHYHKELDELMFVLDGTATVMVEDVFYDIPAGGWHFRPRHKTHTFFNKTDKPFRGIDMYFNQNFEDYLEEIFHKIVPEIQQKKLPPNDPGIAKRMQDLHEKFGVVGFPEKRQGIIDKFKLVP